LDLVHLCCLIRCWADVEAGRGFPAEPPALKQGAPSQLEHYRAKDGGYNARAGSELSTPYGCFLAAGAYQDLQTELPNVSALIRGLANLQKENGSWDNASNATAAAIATQKQLKAPIKPAAGEWLLARCHAQGGFLAVPNAPMPDLLSTATALNALASVGISLEPIREKCLDYLDSLWTNAGSFHGHWLDETLDCEYTFYALLALGHLFAC
jgi:hypothetical protein